jgi:hypothetical protein
MSSAIHFYEIDPGPGGIWWEGRMEDGPYIGTWYESGMLEIARIFRLANHPVHFHTQAEYLLDLQLEEMLGG